MNCACGCGQDAGVTIATGGGYTEGKPKSFIKGHSNKGRRSTHCKCGLPRTPENTNKAGYCRACCNAAQERHRERNPLSSRGTHLFARYGVTKEEFEAQLKKQDHKCLICGVFMDYSNRATTPNLDHDHSTGKFRGVLCHYYNVALGNFKDSVGLLERAVRYLKETQ
jgi:hypothetical protein